MSRDDQIKSISFQSDQTRRQILFSYWLVVLLAVPLWWTTTSITRLALPEARVKGLQTKQLRFQLHATLDDSFPDSTARYVEEALVRRVRELKLEETFFMDISTGTSSDELVYNVSVNEEASETHMEGRKLIIGTKSIPLGDIPKHITDVLSDQWLASFGPDQKVVQYAPRYRLAFSLMNEDASSGESVLRWDVEPAINRVIQPALKRLSTLHNFTIESQVQYFAPLAFQPVPLEDGSFGLTQEQLSVFVNSAEWTLSSSVSNDPVLHFVIFVPSAQRRPLRILDSEGTPTKSNAFVIPQWGSIYIYNPLLSSSTSKTSHLSLQTLRLPFLNFRTQLLSLLGLSSSSDTGDISDWALDALLRRRAYENAQSAGDTLASIVSLVNQIEGMPVDKDVMEDVEGSLDALDIMYSTPQSSLISLVHQSAEALTQASRAFFNPGMLALLYFPPEHNLAVYTPLLAPVAVPLFVAALREVRKWRSGRR